MNSKGQVLIESLIIMPLFILIISVSLILIILMTNHFYIQYHLQEASFCSLNRNINECLDDLRFNLKKIIFLKIIQTKITNLNSEIKSEAVFQIPNPMCLDKTTPNTCPSFSNIKIQKVISKDEWQ